MSDDLRFHPPGLTFMTDTSTARWVEQSLDRRFACVGALIPRGFDAYARLFHPARNGEGERVRWAEVAAWSGRVTHPLMAFERISAPRAGSGVGALPWNEDPNHGSLDRADAVVLAEFLAQFTETPERCFFAVWDGFGKFTPGATVTLTAPGPGETQVPPEEVLTAERLSGIRRAYLLYTGALSAIASFYVDAWAVSPNIWWPADRKWCVATDIDLDSTYVGANERCIEGLVEHRRFEALRTTLDASTYMTADTLNVCD